MPFYAPDDMRKSKGANNFITISQQTDDSILLKNLNVLMDRKIL